MTDNINGISGLKAPDPIDYQDYEDGRAPKAKFALPDRGTYPLIPTEAPKWGATKKGYLQADLTPLKIVAPGTDFDGYEIRFTRVNTQKWPKRNANGMADYLRSHGFQGVCQTNEEYQQAVEGLVGNPAHGVVDWEAYCKTCGFTLKGQANFPKDTEGKFVPYVNCPTCSTSEEAKRVWANVRVVAFVPPDQA